MPRERAWDAESLHYKIFKNTFVLNLSYFIPGFDKQQPEATSVPPQL